jgi:hypothetical protein
MADAPQPDELNDDDDRLPGLSMKERISAGAVGLGGVGAGGAGVFLSSNQAGTSAILILGAMFLLMAVQGTRIIKLSKDGAELERKFRQARRLVEKAADEAADGNLQAAVAYQDAAKAIEPRIEREPIARVVTAQIYELEAYEAVRRAYDNLVKSGRVKSVPGSTLTFNPDSDPRTGYRYDAVLNRPGERPIIFEMKLSRSGSPLRSSIVEQAGQQIKATGGRGLLITNAPTSEGATSLGSSDFQAVTWRDESDDAAVEGALARLLSENQNGA